MLQLLSRHNLRTHFTLLLAGFLAMFGLSTFVISVHARQALDQQILVGQQLTRNLDALTELRRAILGAAASFGKLEGLSARQQLTEMHDTVDWYFQDAFDVYAVNSTPTVSGTLSDALREWEMIVAAVTGADTPEATEQVRNEVGTRFASINALLSRAYAATRIETARELNRAEFGTRQTVGWMAVLVAIALSTGALVVFSLYRRVLAPLRVLRDGAESWQAGDLSYRMPLTAQDEIGDLAYVLNGMVERLQSLVMRLEDENAHDGLTGLLNRREFDIELDGELQRARRYQHSLSLMIIDIDHFKQVNDRFGHIIGDAVLKIVAQRLAASVRTCDIVARYGGEEFAVIAPETDAEGAMRMAARIRRAVAEPMVIPRVRGRVRVTVSIGVAEGAGPVNEENFIAAADAALYNAKSSGRNCECLSPSRASGMSPVDRPQP